MFLLLSFGLILERGQIRLHIFADDTQRLMVTVAIPSGDAVAHLFGLVTHAMLPERSGRCPHQVEDVTVLFNQRTVRFCSLLLVRLIQETTQPIGHIVGQPSAAKLAVRLNPPHRELSHIQLYPLKREQQVCEAVVLECGRVFELGAVQQDSFLSKQLVDAVHPFLKVAAAALEDQPLLIGHVPQVLRGLFSDHLTSSRLALFFLLGEVRPFVFKSVTTGISSLLARWISAHIPSVTGP